MSIIVYGPPGCGLPYYAEHLRRFFELDEFVDHEGDPFPLTIEQQEEFKMGKVLYLTDINPKIVGYDTRWGDYDTKRVFSFEEALKLAAINYSLK